MKKLLFVVAFGTLALAGVAFLLGDAQLTIASATSEIPLSDGGYFLLTVPGDEAPWDPQARITGGPQGALNPGVGNTTWTGHFAAGALSEWRPLTLKLGENKLPTRSGDGGVFTLEVRWSPGYKPTVTGMNATASGVIANVTDANLADGDSLAASEWTIQKDGLPVESKFTGLPMLPYEWKPGTWTVTLVAQDSRGAKSTPATITFEVAQDFAASTTGGSAALEIKQLGDIKYGPSETFEDFGPRRLRIGLARIAIFLFGGEDNLPSWVAEAIF